MRRQLDMIGSHRLWLGMLGVSALALLPGCGMFDGGSLPSQSLKERPGAERQVAASNSLRSAPSGRQYEPGIAPVDETRTGPRIGSIVAGLGGQKAQKEALDKEASERDAKAREQRQARATADKEAKDREPAAPAGTAPVAPSDRAPPSEQAAVAPPAPVSTAPIAPVAAEPAPVAQPIAPSPAPAPPPAPVVAAEAPTPAPAAVTVAAAPARPANPDKAFEPPPGWVPPGQAAVLTAASAAPAASAPTPAASTFVASTSITPAPAAPEPPPRPVVTTVPQAEPPAPVPGPLNVAAAAARPANPNKAFEPPPGWVPPGQIAAPTVAPTEAPLPVGAAEPPAPAPAPVTVAAAPARPANPNKAFEPPPGWAPPGQTAAPAVAAIAPPPPVVTLAPQAEPATPAPAGQPQMATIDFAHQSIDLSNAMKAELDRVAKTFAGRIEVRSYFGAPDPDSRKVSLARALIVRKYLIDRGVKSRAIEVGTFSAASAGARGERVDILASPVDQPAPEPATVAAAPAGSANPNRAFEPPPGWTPSGRMAAPVVAAPAVASAAPSQPVVTPAPQAEPATPPPANQALMGTVGFAGQSVELSDAMKAELDRVAKKFADRSPRQIEVRSYSGGIDPFSRQVSLARALIVRSYLIDRGVKAKAIEVGTSSADVAGAEGERVDILAIGL